MDETNGKEAECASSTRIEHFVIGKVENCKYSDQKINSHFLKVVLHRKTQNTNERFN